jgi:hypothetical protein
VRKAFLPQPSRLPASAGEGLLRAISTKSRQVSWGGRTRRRGMGSPQESYTGSQSCRVMADLVGGHQSSARALDGGWEVPARCYADFRGLSERRANTRSPACVSAPSEAFPRLAHRRMASATSALVACCSPSGVFLQTRSNATSIFARVRISKLLSIMASAHSRPDQYAIVRDHSHVAQAVRPRPSCG